MIRKQISLGLDIGVNSIGWAIVEEDLKTFEDSASHKAPERLAGQILDMGVHIPGIDVTDRELITKGVGETKNSVRGNARQARRQLQRYKQRRERLIKALVDKGFWRKGLAVSEIFAEYDRLSLYELRVKALNEQITLQDFGRILFHLNQRRGYYSNAKSDEGVEKDKTAGEYLIKMKSLEDFLIERDLTPGQFFYQELNNDEHYRIKNKIIRRRQYKAEFDKIWNFQNQFYPEILNNENYAELKDRIIYYHRKLKSQKGNVGICRFEIGVAPKKQNDEKVKYKENAKKVCPKSHPKAQEFIIWQILNNVKITHISEPERGLNEVEKQRLFKNLQKSELIKGEQLLKKDNLNLNQDYIHNFKQGIKGNKTLIKLRKAFKDNNLPFEVFEQNEDNFIALWHFIYSASSNLDLEHYTKSLIKFLSKYYTTPNDKYPELVLNEDTVQKLVAVSFTNDGYSNLSLKAINKLLPKMNGQELAVLEKVDKETGEIVSKVEYKYAPYHIAAEVVYGGHSDSMNRIVYSDRIIIPALKPHELRNPVVTSLVNESISLVNALAEKHLADGQQFNRIVIEMARELNASKEERVNSDKNMRANEKRNKAIETELERLRLKVNKRNRERFRLWKEQNMTCFYSGKSISLIHLFDKGLVDIDHIFPKARYFDDSLSNKVVVYRVENESKGALTAREYIETKGEEKAAELRQLWKSRLSFNKDLDSFTYPIPYSRYTKLLSFKIPQDFVNRQLKDTQYIAKKLSDVLRPMASDYGIIFSSGAITSHIRNEWGLTETFNRLVAKENLREVFSNAELIESLGNSIDDNGNYNTKIEHTEKDKSTETETEQNLAKKCREDHRHHAIDALVLALTHRKDIQKLNTLNASKSKEYWSNNKESKRKAWSIDKPWDGFNKEAILYIHSICVSHKSKRRVLVPRKNKLKKDGKVFHIQNTYSVRGPLHKESVYGKIKHPANLKEVFVIRKPLQSIENFKQAKKIIDPVIKKIVIERLENSENKKKAFEKPLWLNEGKKVQIISVRMAVESEAMISIRTHSEVDKNQYVIPRNNLYTAFNKYRNGKVKIEAMTFIEAVTMTLQGVDPYKYSPAGAEQIMRLQINDMVLIGLDPETLNLNDKKNRSKIKNHLYRVQKCSDYIVYRHHSKSSTPLPKELIAETKIFNSFMSTSYKPNLIYPITFNKNGTMKVK